MPKPTTAHGRLILLSTCVLTVAWCVASHVPPSEAARLNIFKTDWLAHGSGYMVLGACWFLSACSRFRGSPLHCGLLVWLALALLGMLDEATQPLVGRVCSLTDWIADAVGAALGITGAGAMVFRFASPSREKEVLDDVHDRVHVAEHHPQRDNP